MEKDPRASHWEDTLFALNFQGDLESAVKLLLAFEEGASWIEGKMARRGLRFVRPQITLVDDLWPVRYRARQSHAGPVLEICARRLVDVSYQSLTEVTQIYTMIGEQFFCGSWLEHAAIAGVEEAHHAIRNQFKFSPPHQTEHRVPLAQYHGDTFEYDALIWKCRFAKEKQMATYELFAKVLTDAWPFYLSNRVRELRLLELHQVNRRESLERLGRQAGPDLEVA